MTTSKVYTHTSGRRSRDEVDVSFGRRGGGTRPSLVNPWSRALEKGRRRKVGQREALANATTQLAVRDRQTRRLAFSLDYLSTTRSIDYE